MTESKVIVPKILARVTVIVEYTEFINDKPHTKKYLKGKASSFDLSTELKDTIKRATLNALVINENNRGTVVNDTNDFKNLIRDFNVKVVDYQIDYIQKFRHKDEMKEIKIKRVKRKNKYYTFVWNADGKFRKGFPKRFSPVGLKKVNEVGFQDFNDVKDYELE